MPESNLPSTLPRARSKTTYYHNGIGGRGNYHKRADPNPSQQHRSPFSRSIATLFSVGSGNDISPANPSLIGKKPIKTSSPPPPRLRGTHFPAQWFVSLGAFCSRRSSRHHSLDSDMSYATVTSENSNRTLPLGAADAMRRKMLGKQSAAKTREG